MAKYQKEVRKLVEVELAEDAVLSLTAAGKRLGISPSALSDMMNRGRLTRVIDPREPNPTKANRVLAVEVEAEISRRKGRRDDSRLVRRYRRVELR